VKDGALHEGSARLAGGVLIQRNDVGPGASQERAHGGDQAGPICAAQQQSAEIAQRQITPVSGKLGSRDTHCGIP
jgi:hypothetical protein